MEADPDLMIYVLEHLGENIPPHPSNLFYTELLHSTIRQLQSKLMPLMIGLDPMHRLTKEQIARLEKIWGPKTDTTHLLQIAQRLPGEDAATLRRRLQDGDPMVRKLTMQLIAKKRLPLERELFDRLTNSDDRPTAHDALIRLARGVDFGAGPNTPGKYLPRAIAKWRHWLELQESARTDAAAQTARKRGDRLAMGIIARSDDRIAARLRGELIAARGPEQESALRQLKEGEGRCYTDALLQAIPELSGAMRDKARAALAERLAHLDIEPFRLALHDDRAEMRRAAARACALRKERGRVPDLIHLLRDADAGVVDAAHGALKELTERDFGPDDPADAAQRKKAEEAWLKWWRAQQKVSDASQKRSSDASAKRR